MRKESEQSLLVGPGRGMVTSTDRILFTAYEYTGGDKNSVAIYSDDGGKTWERGQSVSGWSSEAVVTEANGKLYMFTRHGVIMFLPILEKHGQIGRIWGFSIVRHVS